MSLRILHVLQTLGTGGLENGVVNLVNRMDASRFSVDILCLRGRGELEARITQPGCRIHFYPALAEGIPASIRAVRKAARAGQYQILHTHGWATMLPGYLGGKLARTPLIINGEHGTFYDDSPRRRLLQKWLFEAVDLNIPVSADLKTQVFQRFDAQKARLEPIINGVDCTRFQPSADHRQRLRRELGIANNSFVVGTVGRLHPVKDYVSLVRGFAPLAKADRDARLLFIGDGTERAALAATAAELDISEQVLLPGRRDDVPQLMNVMDVFALTSISEGLSNTILEAMACGLPVVATAVGGNPEIVFPGETGYLVEVHAPQQLAEAFTRLQASPALRTDMAQAARRRATEQFSLDRMVRNYEQAYSGLAAEAGLAVPA